MHFSSASMNYLSSRIVAGDLDIRSSQQLQLAYYDAL